ncbi:MAG: hypothetical protein C0508_24960 [Cyanobacteria bacterium PR.023]|nr:hypothetical protein [Cyanobacteria bacterium PR.023]
MRDVELAPDIARMKTVLEKIVNLLRSGDCEDWAATMEKISSEIEENPEYATSRILALYGGMGSFNDIVLCSNDLPLIKENDELDELGGELFDLCYSYRLI